MKVIQSEGGPLIGLNRQLVHHWSGISGKNFFGDNSPCANDYEALCQILSQKKDGPSNIGLISNAVTQAFLIRIPDETAVIQANEQGVYIAQVEAAEPDWSFSMLNRDMFDKVTYNEKKSFEFHATDSEYVMFDAAFDGENEKPDCLEFRLHKGLYKISDGTFNHGDLAELILIKIEKVFA